MLTGCYRLSFNGRRIEPRSRGLQLPTQFDRFTMVPGGFRAYLIDRCAQLAHLFLELTNGGADRFGLGR